MSMNENNTDIAKDFVKEMNGLAARRRPLEVVWQNIMELIDPPNAFITRKYNATQMWNEQLYSTTALRALPKFVAALQSTVTPPNERWHRLTPPNRQLKKDQKCIGYLENLTDDLFEMRYRPAGGFNKAIIKIWHGYGKIGLGCMFVDEDKNGDGAIYQAVNMKDFYPVLYSDSTIKRCFRKMTKSAWELCEDLRSKGIDPDKVIPDEVKRGFAQNKNKQLNLIHVVYKMTPEEIGKNAVTVTRTDGTKYEIRYKYKSYLILNESRKPVILETGFFFTCPYMFTRYQELDYDIYSSSPSLQASPDIRMMQRMRKSTIESAEKAVDPPLLARSDAAFGGLMPISGAIMPGTLDDQGRELLKPLDTSGSAGLGVDMEELITKGIEDFYLVPLYMMYYQSGEMTATEVNQRAMERAMLMSINVFPIENELLDPMVMRELDIMQRQGKLPADMPEELRALMNADAPFCSVQYEGEQHKAQELIKANGIASTAQAATVLTNFDEHIPLAFKTIKCLRTFAGANGMPADHLEDDDDYQEKCNKYDQAKQQQAAQLMAMQSGTAEAAGQVAANLGQRLSEMRY